MKYGNATNRPTKTTEIQRTIFAVRREGGAQLSSAHSGSRRYADTKPTPSKIMVRPRNHGRYGSNRVLAAPRAPAPSTAATTGPMQHTDAAVAATTDATTAFIRDFLNGHGLLGRCALFQTWSLGARWCAE